MKRSSPRSAFTLIELLVVIAIISVLITLLMTVLSSAQKKGYQVKAMSNLRQVGTAFMLFAGEHDYMLPGRQADGSNSDTPKWPAVLAGTDGTGTQNLTTNYVGDVKVYVAPLVDPTLNINRTDLFEYLTNNNTNNTNWVMNGYDDLGSKDNPGAPVRTLQFTDQANTILLGVEKTGLPHYYMDFSDGDNTEILNYAAYNGSSPYLFGDGSVRFITEKEYKAAAPAGPTNADNYGDWLWLADKTKPAPTP